MVDRIGNLGNSGNNLPDIAEDVASLVASFGQLVAFNLGIGARGVEVTAPLQDNFSALPRTPPVAYLFLVRRSIVHPVS